jgi:type II secretory pathway pseudopilin PulG
MRTFKRQSIRGSSLIEAMISLTILAVAMLGMSGALVASTKQDRINNSRAAAQVVANEMAASIRNWKFEDARLTPVNEYTGAKFANPTVTSYTLTHATDSSPSSAVDTFDYAPDHDDGDLDSTFDGRPIAEVNLEEPGKTYAFQRYWNVRTDATSMKFIAVHVTYQRTPTERGVVSAYTTVYSRSVLVDRMGGL